MGNYEQVTSLDGKETLYRHYIVGPSGLIGIFVVRNGVGTMYYTFTDHLGSIYKITDDQFEVKQEQSYDAWGRKRATDTHIYQEPIATYLHGLPICTRGYTLHEHLDGAQLIHMRARLYDPKLGIFLSIDPLSTQYPQISPYAYALNNPLRYLDPTGRAVEDDKEKLEKALSETMKSIAENNQQIASNNAKIKELNAAKFTSEASSREIQNLQSSNNYLSAQNHHLEQQAGQYHGELANLDRTEQYRQDLSSSGVGTGAQGHALGSQSSRAQSGGGLNTANDWLGYAGYAEVAIGAGQIGMLGYRQSLSISSKIGTFGSFSSTYRALGTTGKVLGGAGYLGEGLNTYLDYKSMQSGEIGAGRFGYRTAGTLGSIGGSIGIGAVYGGPWGAVGGAVIGGASWAGEKAYDGYMYWQTQMSIYLTNFENGLKSGWVPGR